MTRKKQDKRDPFGGLSYAERVAKQEEEADEKKQRPDRRPRPMTYRIGDDVIERINNVAERENVQKSDLVRALLIHALDALDRGQWELPIDERPRRLDV